MNTGRTTFPFSTAHATYGEMVHPSRDRNIRNQPRDPAGVLYSGSIARIDAPLSVPTSTINWWPYPPWGQSTVSLTPSVTTTASISPSPVAALSASPPASTTTSSSLEPASSSSSSPAPSSTVITVTTPPATPPATSLLSRPGVNATAHSSFNPLYLIPVFIVVGLLLGALSGLLGYRWYMRRLARKGGAGGGNWNGSFISGPPYIPMRDLSQNAGPGGTEESSSNLAGSPSKYTRHGARHATKAWLSSVTRVGSRRASVRSTVPPSSQDSIGAAASSHSRPTTTSRSLARSQVSTMSPTPRSDVEDSRRDIYTRNTSIRRNLLERMQRGSDRTPRSVTRDPSRRTTQTYLSSASAYSGTHADDSLSPSAVPSSAPSEWEPGSGFRIIVEDNATPRPPTSITTATDNSSASTSVSGLPGRTSAWDNGEALRQAVNTHPGERWLAWTRSWVSNPPPSGEEDRFTAVPTRRGNAYPKGAEVLLRSPPQVTSSPLQSTLTFSPLPPQPGLSPHGITANNRNNKFQPIQAPARTRAVPQPQSQPQANAGRGTSSASSIVPEGGGHGTPAMRYAARHTALSRVEEILAHSYSARDLIPPDSPNAFGATPASMEDIAWAAGIEHRLAIAASADKG